LPIHRTRGGRIEEAGSGLHGGCIDCFVGAVDGDSGKGMADAPTGIDDSRGRGGLGKLVRAGIPRTANRKRATLRHERYDLCAPDTAIRDYGSDH